MYEAILHPTSLLKALKLKLNSNLSSIINQKQTEIYNIYSLEKRDLKTPTFRASTIKLLLKILKKPTLNLNRLFQKNKYSKNTTLRNKINFKGCVK